MNRSKIVELFDAKAPAEKILVKGWIKTKRDSKEFSFLEINDGSCLKNFQIIADKTLKNYESITYDVSIILCAADSK